MNLIKTDFEDLFLIKNKIFNDERGEFYRTYCKKEMKKAGINFDCVQSNYSFNIKKGTLRGLHYQNKPFSEKKIIKCINGSIFDVAVDLRKNSKTFLKYFSITLNTISNYSILIPEGFAHGFLTLENNSSLIYCHSNYYNKNYEKGLLFSDKSLNINWPMKPNYISKRDQSHEPLLNFNGI